MAGVSLGACCWLVLLTHMAERTAWCRWVPGLPRLDKVARTVDSGTAMINYLRTLPADEVRSLANVRQRACGSGHAPWRHMCWKCADKYASNKSGLCLQACAA